MNWPKTREDMKDSGELCNHCPLPEDLKGVHCYGGQPVMCEGSHCKEAYQSYLDDVEENNNGWPDDCEDCPLADNNGQCTETNKSDGSTPCDTMSFNEWEKLEKFQD